MHKLKKSRHLRIRLSADEIAHLDALSASTGWSKSEIVRRSLEAATVPELMTLKDLEAHPGKPDKPVV